MRLSGGNETEIFGYDFLDRLTSVAGAYAESYTYNQIGNMLTKNGATYTYPTNGVRPHAVSSVGSTSYVYDSNGNMTTRGSQTITWDVENRPLTVTGGASFIYDGDGNRVKKTEGGQTVLYVNKYYEKNLTTAEITTYYYHGDKLVAKRTGTTVQYIHQDHLTGSSVVSSSAGALVNSIKFYPFGSTRSGDVPTDKKFTGQRLDGTGLYYYGATYYDPSIGRFISPDTVVLSVINPQAFNRYSYVVNNPLRFVDPSGNLIEVPGTPDYASYEYWGMEFDLSGYADSIALWNAIGDLMSSSTAGDIVTSIYDDPEKIVTVEFGNLIGAGGQTVPTDAWAAAGDVLRGAGNVIDWTITIDRSFAGSSELLTIIAHEIFHANDPRLSDSVQEELRAYKFADRVAREKGLPYRSGYGGLDAGNRRHLDEAFSRLTTQPSQPPFYKTLPPYAATNRADDLIVAASQGLWSVSPSLVAGTGANLWTY
jgi:RHS repeat-associated protein